MQFKEKNDYSDELDALLEDHEVAPMVEAGGQKHGLDVLLAITDDDLAPAATAVVRALQDRRDANPSVLYVIEIGPSVPEAVVVAVTLEEELRNPRTRAKQEAEMRSILDLSDGARAAWPFKIEVGSVAATIVENARNQGIDMIVMGLNRHAAVARIMGKDTVREVMALVGVPVLAVRPPLSSLPSRIVVAVDFSRASIRAAHLARRLVDEHGSMHLLFVEPTTIDEKFESAEGLQLIKAKGLEAALKRLTIKLQAPVSMKINTVIRRGDPMTEIIRFCDEIDPDLVAVGSQRHRFLERLLLGSVARSVATDGRWSTLVTPPARPVHAV